MRSGIYSEELRSSGYLDSGVQEFRLKSSDNSQGWSLNY